MPKCPFCNSDNTEIMPLNDGITKSYKIVRKQSMGESIETGTNHYPIVKFICLDCGCVSMRMNETNLEKYKNDKPNFAR